MSIFRSKKRQPRRSPRSDVRLDLGGGSLVGKDFKLSVEEADEAMETLIRRIPGLLPEDSGLGVPTCTTTPPESPGGQSAPSSD